MLGLAGTTMLNPDTEQWGELYVGCAGGGKLTLQLPLKQQTTTAEISDDITLVELWVEGLLGGHSGINMHEGRANAVLLCAAAAHAVLQQVGGVYLVSITGGDKHNAIPREARTQLLVSSREEGARAAMERVVQQCQDAAVAEYGSLEDNL
jgi:dipeptidase D